MAEQLIEDGTVITTDNGTELQLTGVRYEESPTGERSNHEYVFRSVADLTAEREAAEEARRQAEENERLAAENQSTDNNEEGVQ
jgi:hypothetical protein